MNTSTIRPLTEADKTTITRWLASYLEQHLLWWAEAYGTEPKLDLEYLILREWDDLLRASSDNSKYVGVAVQDETALGIVLAKLGTERYLGINLGILGWLYVAEAARGQGVSSALMAATDRWMDAQSVEGRQVYVTNANPAAVKVYERFGYRSVDSRMLAPAPEHLGTP